MNERFGVFRNGLIVRQEVQRVGVMATTVAERLHADLLIKMTGRRFVDDDQTAPGRRSTKALRKLCRCGVDCWVSIVLAMWL